MNLSLSNLTICIFTHERKQDLERLVKYWSSTDIKVIILDTSSQPAKIVNSKNLKYFHTPNTPLHKRLLKFSEIVETKYILLSPDDDFFALEGVGKTLEFLDNNSFLYLKIFNIPFEEKHKIKNETNKDNLIQANSGTAGSDSLLILIELIVKSSSTSTSTYSSSSLSDAIDIITKMKREVVITDENTNKSSRMTIW